MKMQLREHIVQEIALQLTVLRMFPTKVFLFGSLIHDKAKEQIH